jgi:signal transduction histidine kinase
MHIRLNSDAPVYESLPAAVGRTAYRVVQEGLTNARKHAPAAAVDVTISASDHSLIVRVANKHPVGVLATGMQGSGAGLVGLAERVSLLGGELKHGTNENGDFVLIATLPWTQ